MGMVCTIPYFGTKDMLGNSQNALIQSNVSRESSSLSPLCERPPNSTSYYNDQAGSNVTSSSSSSCSSSSSSSSSSSQSGGIHGISEEWRTITIAIFVASLIFQGVAKSPRTAFVGVYIDDNVHKTKSSLYIETQLTPQDPRWLGAWWLGFFLFSGAALVLGIPLFFFPRKIRVRPEIEQAEENRKLERQDHNKFLIEVKGFFKSVVKLMFNPVYMLTVIGGAIHIISVSGYVSFMAKYMEVHFNMPTWRVNIIIGSINISGVCLGTFLGGFLISKLKLSPMGCLKFKFLTMTLSGVGMLGAMLISCDQPQFNAGQQNVIMGNGSSSCVRDCQCDDGVFFPVCGDDGLNYFSPCHAGCSDVVDGGITFSNCSCLSDLSYSQAKGGLCPGSCTTKFWVFSALLGVFGVLNAAGIVPSFIITIRCVPEVLKPTALGISSFASSLLGWFPGPIIFGALIDTTCLISRDDPCKEGSKGVCLLYDLASLRLRFYGLHIGIRVVYLLIIIATMAYASYAKTFEALKDEDDADKKGNKDNDRHDKGTELSLSRPGGKNGGMNSMTSPTGGGNTD